ncbi:hypothetical protein MLD38_033957 [Melastoma candidum]|uniref:Uncharacterized protein n=1 Tax=Melastoma candidum TaxID=119954 RepID=A0ACB9MCT2_9MYRT|nr:hypothetical protein MLD38_033957 [Melastoma candidum]
MCGMERGSGRRRRGRTSQSGITQRGGGLAAFCGRKVERLTDHVLDKGKCVRERKGGSDPWNELCDPFGSNVGEREKKEGVQSIHIETNTEAANGEIKWNEKIMKRMPTKGRVDSRAEPNRTEPIGHGWSCEAESHVLNGQWTCDLVNGTSVPSLTSIVSLISYGYAFLTRCFNRHHRSNPSNHDDILL